MQTLRRTYKEKHKHYWKAYNDGLSDKSKTVEYWGGRTLGKLMAAR